MLNQAIGSNNSSIPESLSLTSTVLVCMPTITMIYKSNLTDRLTRSHGFRETLETWETRHTKGLHVCTRGMRQTFYLRSIIRFFMEKETIIACSPTLDVLFPAVVGRPSQRCASIRMGRGITVSKSYAQRKCHVVH